MHFFLKEKADIGPCMDIKAHNGLLYAIDISSTQKPRVTTAISTNTSPAKAIFVGERILMPGGRSGLLELILS